MPNFFENPVPVIDAMHEASSRQQANNIDAKMSAMANAMNSKDLNKVEAKYRDSEAQRDNLHAQTAQDRVIKTFNQGEPN